MQMRESWKKYLLLLLFISIIFLFSCWDQMWDYGTGIGVKYYDVDIPIEQIYFTLKDNLNYNEIELSSYGLITIHFITKYNEQDYNVYIWVHYVEETKNNQTNKYLSISSDTWHMDKKEKDHIKIKINEVKEFLIKYFPQNFNKNNFIEYKYP
jgi:hypothetical protein